MSSSPDPTTDVPTPDPAAKAPGWDLIGITTRRDLVPLLVISLVVGLSAGWFLFPDEWTSVNRLGAGFMLGVGAWLILYANRMVGGADVY